MEQIESNPHPEISIVIVNFNSGEFLAGTLQSILKHPPSAEWEAIIFDNASTDASLERAKSLVKSDARFRLIMNDANAGYGKGNNLGAKDARGDYILLLNPDTEITENAIDRLYQYLKNNNDVGAVGPCLIGSDGSSTVSFGFFPNAKGIITEAFFPGRFQNAKSGGLGIVPDSSITEPLDVGYVSSACLLTKRSIWNELDGFDENFFTYFEETDWCWRLRRKLGLRSVFIPFAVVKHFEGRSFTGVPYRKMKIFVKSAMRFFNQYYPPPLKYLYVVSNIIASAMKVVYLILTGWVSTNRWKRVQPVLAYQKAFLVSLIKYGR